MVPYRAQRHINRHEFCHGSRIPRLCRMILVKNRTRRHFNYKGRAGKRLVCPNAEKGRRETEERAQGLSEGISGANRFSGCWIWRQAFAFKVHVGIPAVSGRAHEKPFLRLTRMSVSEKRRNAATRRRLGSVVRRPHIARRHRCSNWAISRQSWRRMRQGANRESLGELIETLVMPAAIDSKKMRRRTDSLQFCGAPLILAGRLRHPDQLK